MVVIGYTDTDKIRAAMGVTENEVSDKQITDLQIGLQLDLFFGQVEPDAEAIKAAAQEDPPPDPVTVEYTEAVRTWKCIQLLATYQGAVIMLVAHQTLLWQQVSDGGVTQFRFAPDNITTLLANVTAQRDRYWRLLDPAFVVASIMPSLISGVKPGYDPVTNIGSPKPISNALVGLGTPYGYVCWRGLF